MGSEGTGAEPRRCAAVVLAAGEGTRMRSSLPKPLHPVAGRSMLAHVLNAAASVGAARLAVVVGPDREDVAAEACRAVPDAQTFVQRERRGTAHAVLAARGALDGADDLLVLYADVPLVLPPTLQRLRAALAAGAGVAVLGFRAADPTGYGRLLTDQAGDLLAIREHKDASAAERGVSLVNAGLMAIDGRHAAAWLDRIGTNNAQGEFYLTDVVEVARAAGRRCVAVETTADEVLGVNDRVQLAAVEAVLQKRLREAAMRGGATLTAPDTVVLSHDTRLGADVLVEPHCVFGPGVEVGPGATVRAFSRLVHRVVPPGSVVGPFAGM